jgi:hypothetical protein
MRAAAWGVPVLLVSACAAGTTPVAAPAPSPTTTAKIAAIWDVERASAASRVVDVSFTAAACSVVKRVVVDEQPERVVITLDQAGRNGKDCTEPFLRHRRVRLKAALGGRALYDGGIAPPQLVRPGQSDTER